MCTACSCTTDATTATIETDSDAALAEQSGHTSEFTVMGMTCGHCVGSVTQEVQQINGVRDVLVDLETGALTVAADQPLQREAVTAAVRRAGYDVA